MCRRSAISKTGTGIECQFKLMLKLVHLNKDRQACGDMHSNRCHSRHYKTVFFVLSLFFLTAKAHILLGQSFGHVCLFEQAIESRYKVWETDLLTENRQMIVFGSVARGEQAAEKCINHKQQQQQWQQYRLTAMGRKRKQRKGKMTIAI